nr:protein thylakoid formation1, chloroplastic [Tanacetum cinerariifolium]
MGYCSTSARFSRQPFLHHYSTSQPFSTSPTTSPMTPPPFPAQTHTPMAINSRRQAEEKNKPPPVSETKLKFLTAYKRPIPSVYNTVLQELIVQQHLMRYKKTYRYDAVFALGFVTVYDQLMDGYPSDEDKENIFQAYVNALNEDPQQYRSDAQKLEEWARTQSSATLVDFSSREGEIEGILKDIAERAGGNGSFSYSRFFAVGLFRLLELSKATEPTILEKVQNIMLLSNNEIINRK